MLSRDKSVWKRQTYHLGSSNFHNIAAGGSKRRLTTHHVGAIAQHEHADEGVAVSVPSDHGRIIFPWTSGDTLIVLKAFFLAVDGRQLLLCLLLRLDREVDVGNLGAHGRYKVHTSNLGDNRQGFRVVPCIIGEGCVPGYD